MSSRLAQAAYSALLFVYPTEFRDEYGAEMRHLFAMRLATEAPWRVWLEVLADAAMTAPREHLHILAGDVRHGARVLLKSPGFTLAALLAIVLGVSSATTVFSLIDAVVIHSLPYGNPERLVYLWTPVVNAAGLWQEFTPYYSDMTEWRRSSVSFESFTAVQRYLAAIDGGTQRIGAARVLGNFFETLQSPSQLGRPIAMEDDHPGKQFVAVISHALWQSKFGGDPRVLGRTIQLDRQPYRVIGVMPREFSYPGGKDYPHQPQFAWLTRTDIWVPAALTAKQEAERDFDGFDAVLGRLATGTTLAQAQAEISSIQNRLQPHPEGPMHAQVVPFVETAIGPARPLLGLLMGAVGLVLLLASSNLAGLLLARASDRMHELGVRRALGAGRPRLVRLLLTESLMLSATGGVLALVLSYGLVHLLVRLNPGDIPRFEDTTLDLRVLCFGLAVALGSGFVSGVLPAMSTSTVNVVALLRQGGRGIAGSSWRARSALIVAEIGLAVVLLAGAGLLVRSYLVMQREDKGFAPSTLTLSVVVDTQTPGADPLRRAVMERIRILPGVQAAGSIDDLPLSKMEDRGFIEVEGDTSVLHQTASVRETGGEYFRSMQIPLIEGRYLNDGDITPTAAPGPKVVEVSAAFARRYFVGRSAVGHRLRINESSWAVIVGVVGDVRDASLEEPPRPTIYYQNGLADSVAIRTDQPVTVLQAVREAVKQMNAAISIADVQTMDRYIGVAGARRRFQTATVTAFAAVAVFLTLVGLYGLLSYAVAQRNAEIGVRMALGASRGAVITMVVRSGLLLMAGGLAIGLSLSAVLGHLMAGFLYGVRVFDPVTFVGVPILMLGVTAAACAVPAWKAARVDPVDALRRGAN